MAESYTESHKAEGKGESYHRSFAERNYRRLVWHWEQRVLDQIVVERSTEKTLDTHLDFACGTGRITSHLLGKARSSFGVDVSPSMLDIATQSAPEAQLELVDLTKQSLPVSWPASFDLITAFRFFLNAEPALRLRVMSVLAGLLANDGVLVFNNHMRTHSVRGQATRIYTRLRHGTWDRYATMSESDVLKLLDPLGLRISQTHYFGVWPTSFSEKTRIPLQFHEQFEAFAARSDALQKLSAYAIYTVRRR